MTTQLLAPTEGGTVRGSARGGRRPLPRDPVRGRRHASSHPEPAPRGRAPATPHAYGPMSPQIPGELYLRTEAGYSEDCLSLNVWTPDPGRARDR